MKIHVSRGGLFLALAAALALSWACRREPDELLFIVGRVVDQQGDVAPGVPVELLKNGSQNCYSTFFGTLPPEFDAGTYAALGTTESNARGDYLFDLLHRDTQTDDGAYRSPACFQLQARTDAAESTISFTHSGADMEATDLPLRTEGVEAEAVDGGVLLHPGAPLALSQYTISLTGWDLHAGAPEPAWVSWDADGGAGLPTMVPGYLLEDFGAVTATHRSVAAYDREQPPLSMDGYVFYMLDVRSSIALSSAPIVPLSRGATCTPAALDGGVCPLTDGRLESYSFTSLGPPQPLPDGGYEIPPPAPGELVLDLGEARSVSRMVLRGLDFSIPADELLVEVSGDGQEWARAGSQGPFARPDTQDDYLLFMLRDRRARGLYADIELSAPGPVRYLRLRGIGGRFPDQPPEAPTQDVLFFRAQELSVY